MRRLEGEKVRFFFEFRVTFINPDRSEQTEAGKISCNQ